LVEMFSKIFFRNHIYRDVFENLTFRKFPAIRYFTYVITIIQWLIVIAKQCIYIYEMVTFYYSLNVKSIKYCRAKQTFSEFKSFLYHSYQFFTIALVNKLTCIIMDAASSNMWLFQKIICFSNALATREQTWGHLFIAQIFYQLYLNYIIILLMQIFSLI